MLQHSPGPADMFPTLEAPLVEYRGRLSNIANDDRVLIAIMAEYGLGTVLCAGQASPRNRVRLLQSVSK